MTTFDDILGQNAATQFLAQALLADRLPHGLIFAGPYGVGKATTARALAALFLCEKRKGDKPCGKCASCHLVEAGTHPDLHVVTKELVRDIKDSEAKATAMSVDVVRHALVAPANLKSALGIGKVFIVEQADLMTPEAQNALLKTLEEPLGRTLIILLTDNPLSLLPTVRSRSQIIPFAPLDQALVQSELAKRGISKADASEAAALSEGSLGLALRMIEDGVLPHARELRHRLEHILSGRPMPDLPDFFKAIAEEYAEKQLARDPMASKNQAVRDGMTLYLRLASQELRRRLEAAADPEDLERICSAIDALARADEFLDANVTIPLVFQQVAVTLERLFAGSPSGR